MQFYKNLTRGIYFAQQKSATWSRSVWLKWRTFKTSCVGTAKYAKLYGAVYVLVNNTEETGGNVAASVKSRAFPYLTVIFPEQLLEWQHDDRGRLVSITWQDVSTDNQGHQTRSVSTWTDEWWHVEQNGKVVTAGRHGLGLVPVVRWCGRATEPTNMLPTSEFISVAQANNYLYQVCSWHTQILRDQAFSILTMPNIGDDDSVTIGTNNVLAYPPESTHTPAFIAPSAEPAAMLTDQMDRIIREMYRMCGLSSVVGVHEAKSGVAKQWEFERTNQKLAEFAIQCEEVEYLIVSIFEKWTHEATDYFCEYPRDFKINDVADALSNAQAALELNIGGAEYRKEVGRKVLDGYLPNIQPDTYDAIMAEFDERAEEEQPGESPVIDETNE